MFAVKTYILQSFVDLFPVFFIGPQTQIAEESHQIFVELNSPSKLAVYYDDTDRALSSIPQALVMAWHMREKSGADNGKAAQ